ncbi:hypothetical protein L798_14781 [Zootermopsis nevadensis]|uniref:Uncharacterized protein n=1 Tax=Zootermopsis nevadensis TaxID=136037 RepID=A0A067RSX7_ZOONE|nr:hypothetical protein L798_14781 [Zootermopsis nevadensis]
MCFKFRGLIWPIIDSAPMCIITDASPSRQNTCRLGFFSAIPRAIVDACPIDPTVRKSLSWPCSRATRCSNSSRESIPVVLTTTSLS